MFSTFKQYIIKHFVSFLVYIIIACVIGAGIWYLQPEIYVAEMTVSYTHYEKKIYADMLVKLNDLIKTNNYSQLSDLLMMTEEEVKELVSINSLNIRSEPLVDDLSTEKIPFYVIAEVRNNDILGSLQIALVNYMDRTDYIQKRIAYMNKENEAELEFLENRLASVDSLSNLLLINDRELKQEEAVKRAELLDEALKIYQRIRTVRGALVFNYNIEVLDGFVANDHPVSRSLTKYLFYAVLAGIGLRVIVLLFRP